MMRIDRATALARIADRYDGPCLMCAVLAAPDLPEQQLAAGPECVVVYSRFPLVEGHVLVITRHHLETIADMPDSTWLAMCALGQKAARILEAQYRPARTYVASLGAAQGAAPQTCPHVHLHVIPVSNAGTRPADLLTWQHGVIDSETATWRGDVQTLRAAFNRKSETPSPR